MRKVIMHKTTMQFFKSQYITFTRTFFSVRYSILPTYLTMNLRCLVNCHLHYYIYIYINILYKHLRTSKACRKLHIKVLLKEYPFIVLSL